MIKIYKYPISITDIQVVQLPVNSKVLTVQIQNDIPCLWAMVDVNEQRIVSRHILTFGTGHPIDGVSIVYISTYQTNGLVFHVFESI